MLFNSFQFAVFFPTVVALYFTLAHRYRWILLLVSSYLFYMAWEPGYVVLIWVSTLVDYFAAIWMAKTGERGRRRGLLLLSLATNLGLLFFFKYYNFFSDSLGAALGSIGWQVEIPYSAFLLPAGISFYTFQTLSYTIEVYRGKQEPEYHLGRFALYVSFFPQLVAGPIERASNMLPQYLERHDFDYDRVTSGLKLMVWGLLKKAVIADRLSVVVDTVFSNPLDHAGPVLVLGAVFFTFQIYCDFSGYSDIAIGGARVLGFRLMDNFRRPFFATSIQEVWRRWHISLSTWFRDYVYFTLGGSRHGVFRTYVCLLVVFVVSGLWHGASWTFAVWGLLHAVYMIAGRVLLPLRARCAAVVGVPWLLYGWRVVVTFSLFTFAFIFFRADTIGVAFYYVQHLGSGWSVVFDAEAWSVLPRSLGVWPWEFWICVGLVVGLTVLEGIDEWFSRGGKVGIATRILRQPIAVRWAVYSAGLWMIFLFGVLRQTQFIYYVF